MISKLFPGFHVENYSHRSDFSPLLTFYLVRSSVTCFLVHCKISANICPQTHHASPLKTWTEVNRERYASKAKVDCLSP